MSTNPVVRCQWVGNDPLYRDYHDHEWGVPLHGEQALFELLTLEGAQAGLSWITILKRRQGYRRAFDGFVIERIADYGASEIERLLADQGIIRNRRKIVSTIGNARATLELQARFGGIDPFLWQFVDGKPVINRWRDGSQVPTSTPLSDSVSRELKRHGFSFVGTTIIYSLLQAAGLVNDHTSDCFRYPAAEG